MDNHEKYCKIRQANVYPKLEHGNLEMMYIKNYKRMAADYGNR